MNIFTYIHICNKSAQTCMCLNQMRLIITHRTEPLPRAHACSSSFWQSGDWCYYLRSPRNSWPCGSVCNHFTTVVVAVDSPVERPGKWNKETHIQHSTWHVWEVMLVSPWSEKLLQLMSSRRWRDGCRPCQGCHIASKLLDCSRNRLFVECKLRMLRDLFWKKSPHTLKKRIHSLLVYLSFLHEHLLFFPCSEPMLYNFLHKERLAGHIHYCYALLHIAWGGSGRFVQGIYVMCTLCWWEFDERDLKVLVRVVEYVMLSKRWGLRWSLVLDGMFKIGYIGGC